MLKFPLKTLIECTERLFHLTPGDVVSQDRSQPLASIRMLAYLVARDQGHTCGAIARVFERDRSSVEHGVSTARQRMRDGHPWWANAKAELVDAWAEEMGGQWIA